jgi:HAD superfamily hydrolase (TIGR01450 family)
LTKVEDVRHAAPGSGLLIDMDGVLFHGDRALPGAREFLDRVTGSPYLFLTNNPTRLPTEVSAQLARLGLGRHSPERVLTSGQAAAAWLAREHPGFRYYAVGADGLDRVLATVGTADPENADVVVVGEGPGLDYESLAIGINLVLKRGARLVVTNPDTTVDADRDGAHWVLPGGGALVAPFAVATGCEPVVIGKPEPLLYELAADRLGVPVHRCVMLGDRPDTDIAGAARLGMKTVLVRTGRFPPGTPWPEGLPLADWDFPDLAALLLQFEDVFGDLR